MTRGTCLGRRVLELESLGQASGSEVDVVEADGNEGDGFCGCGAEAKR